MMKIRDVDIDRWYTCYYPDRPELCKVTRGIIEDPATKARVYTYKVVCYYHGNDIYVGKLSDCRQWIIDHLEGIKTYG